jgi:hypothetical protein
LIRLANRAGAAPWPYGIATNLIVCIAIPVDPNLLGNAGQYFNVLNGASEWGIVVGHAWSRVGFVEWVPFSVGQISRCTAFREKMSVMAFSR